ncbi:MAG: damage-inducible protein DinB, partial [Acidobacteria bacterium]|nr:damage-inducible protein DinB [Acidobacteriota bacterium]
QIHHRGAMSVLVRQAGLVLPDIYGPTREQMAAMKG